MIHHCVLLTVASLAILAHCDAQLQEQPLGNAQQQLGSGLDAATADYVSTLEQYVDQYRTLIAKSIVRLAGACAAYDRLAATSQRTWYSPEGERLPGGGGGGGGGPVDIEHYIVAVLRQLHGETAEQMATAFEERQSVSTEPGANAMFYIVTTSNLLKDAQLDALLAAMLYDQCCTTGTEAEGVDGRSAAGRCDPERMLLRKRLPLPLPQPQKKQRFHAWGGKRSGGGAGGEGEGGGSPVVIRAPFHAWGGRKRSVE